MAILVALVVDAGLILRLAWVIDSRQTEDLFRHVKMQTGVLVERTVALNFVGLGVMSACVHDLGHHSSVLPIDARIFIYFAAILLIWAGLHHCFAIHYAKKYFECSSKLDQDNGASKLFDFPQEMKPAFFDFLYVSYSIGLTLGMTDVAAAHLEVRKVVLVQAVLAFLFTSTAISAIASLFTA